MLRIKNLIIGLLLFNVSSNIQAALKSDTIDVINYSINLDLSNYTSYQIFGNTELKIASKVQGLNYTCLDFLGLSVDSIFVNDNVVSFSYNDTLLKISLPLAQNLGDTFFINVFYHGHPVVDPSGWGGFYFSSGYAFNLGVGFEDNPHNYGRVWYPCIDDFIDRASYDFHIKTSNENTAVCGGVLLSTELNVDSTKTYHWRLNEEIPTYLSSVAVGSYKLVPDTFHGIEGSIPINIYARPTDSTKAVNSFINLKEILSAFETSFGPYRWNRVGYVSVPFNGGAMEHATNIAYPASSIDGTLTDEYLYAHELAHHWFGDLITCNAPEDMWINEGWASFCEYIYMEYLYGKEDAKKYIRNEHAYNVRALHYEDDGFRAVYGIPHEYTYSTTVYEKGATVAHSLRGYLGDSLFFSSVKQLLEEFAYQSISSFQMRDRLSEYSGVDLTAFFDTWVFSPGFPHFAVDSFKVAENGSLYDVTVYMKQKNRGGTHFANQNKVELTFMDKDWNQTTRIIEFSGERGGQTFSLPFNPDIVIADIDEKLCDATVDNYMIIDSAENLSFDKTYFLAYVTQISDSAFLRVEHNWVAPDASVEPVPGLVISDMRYWKIDGILPDTFVASGKFYYNKLANASSYLDHTLVTSISDSLALLYRRDLTRPWELCTLKAGSIFSGYLTDDTLRLGEYVLGVYDYDRFVANIDAEYDCNQSAMLSVSPWGGISPYTYKWNTNQTDSVITVSASDYYTVTVYDANSDSLVLSEIVDIPKPITFQATLGGNNEACDGQIDFNISGGVSPYAIEGINYVILKNNIIVDSLCVGMYTFTITDDNNCSVSDSVNLQGVNNITENLIKIYPNPNNGNFIIQLDNISYEALEIIDVNGRIIYSEKNIKGKKQLYLKNFDEGLYFIKLVNNQHVAIRKVLTSE